MVISAGVGDLYTTSSPSVVSKARPLEMKGPCPVQVYVLECDARCESVCEAHEDDRVSSASLRASEQRTAAAPGAW